MFVTSVFLFLKLCLWGSGIPKISKLEIEGRGFHTNLYAIRAVYFGGKEGKSKIQWLRSMVGSPDLISIPGRRSDLKPKNIFFLFKRPDFPVCMKA